MGLGKWDHIHAVGQLPSVKARWQNQFGREMNSEDIDAIYAHSCHYRKRKSLTTPHQS